MSYYHPVGCHHLDNLTREQSAVCVSKGTGIGSEFVVFGFVSMQVRNHTWGLVNWYFIGVSIIN